MVGVTGAAVDITERKRSEAALLEDREAFAGGRGSGHDRVLGEVGLAGAGLVAGADGAQPQVQKSNPLLALRFKYAVTVAGGDGNVIGAIGILRDMRELDKARAYAESLIKNAPDPVFVSDLEGKILQANDAVSELLGFRRDEVLEQSLSRFISEEETREFTAALREVVERGVTRNARLNPRAATTRYNAGIVWGRLGEHAKARDAYTHGGVPNLFSGVMAFAPGGQPFGLRFLASSSRSWFSATALK